jgi:cytochrome c peroxidase
MNRAESGLGQALRPGWATAGVAVFAGAALGAIGCKQDDNLPASRSEPEAIQMEEGAAGAETDIGVDAALLVIFKPLPALVDSFDNPSTPEKVELGRRLYFDERLSAAGDMSCNSCHPVDRFGTEERALQQGHGWDAPTRNAPSTFNAAGQVAMFWDGRVRTVEHAAERHILGPAPYGLENVDRLKERLASIPEYRPAFERAFPGEALDERTYSKAVGAYLRTLMTPAPWDEFLRWNPNALTREQKLGFLTFMRTGCQNCHIGTYLGGTSFQPLGAEEPWPEPAAGAPAA